MKDEKPWDSYYPAAIDLLPQQPLVEESIGRLVLRLSYAHLVLELNLGTLLRIDPAKGRILTEDLPLSSLATRFYRAAESKAPQPQDLKQLKSLLNNLRRINDKRNRLVHAFWTFPKDGPPMLVPQKGQLVSEKAPMATEILSLVNATDKFIEDFFRCMSRILVTHHDDAPPDS